MIRMFLASCVHPLSHRREIFSCCHRSFTWVEILKNEFELVEIPADVRDAPFAASAPRTLGAARVRLPVGAE
eukprot:4065170-Pyramimonas_sp.AAC.1